jgi:hypothetical protein
LPVDAAGRRVFDETLADWRREHSKALTSVWRMAVALRSSAAVLRGLALVSMREVHSGDGRAAFVRLGLWTTAGLVTFFALNAELLYVVDESGRAPYSYAALGLLSVSWLIGLMPLLAFLSAACAKHTGSPGPRLGPALFVGVAMLALIGWVVPAAGQAFREIVFVRSGGTGVVPPGLAELSLPELIGRLSTKRWGQAAALLNHRVLWVIAVPVLLALGTTVRTLAGWRRLAGSVLPLGVFLAPFAAGIAWPDQLYAFWGGLLTAVLIVRMLAVTATPQEGADASA